LFTLWFRNRDRFEINFITSNVRGQSVYEAWFGTWFGDRADVKRFEFMNRSEQGSSLDEWLNAEIVSSGMDMREICRIGVLFALSRSIFLPGIERSFLMVSLIAED
jgi:hypothetical protein